MKLDNIHLDLSPMDGYQKPFVYIVSARESGKTTTVWIKKAYKIWKATGRTGVVIRRQINDITEDYINSIQYILNKFDIDVTFTFMRGKIKEGSVTVYVDDKIFFRVIALSNPINRIKSNILPNLGWMIYDEFICNPKFKEKYLENEYDKFLEVYNTFRREAPDKFTCYFLGNPYSLYNPYFSRIGVDTKKFVKGNIQCGSNWVAWNYPLRPELIELLRKTNPLYVDDDVYTQYALYGSAVNDMNINLGEKLDGMKLRFIFRIQGFFIACWADYEGNWFCDKCTFEFSAKRKAYCFDFDELVSRSVMLSREDVFKFGTFKSAMRCGNVAFSTIEIYYIIKEIYENI